MPLETKGMRKARKAAAQTEQAQREEADLKLRQQFENEAKEKAEAADAEHRKEAEQYEAEVRSADEEERKRKEEAEAADRAGKQAEADTRLKQWKDEVRKDSVAAAKTIKHNSGATAITDESVLTSRFRIAIKRELVASGPHSQIYKARIGGTDVPDAAVKMVMKRKLYGLAKHNSEYSVHIMRYLIDHPHPSIVAIHDLYATPEKVYIFMELLPSLTVGDHLKSKGPVDEVKAKAWASCVGEAIKYLHTNGIVHLNVRPQNVIIVNDTTANLCGFSNARTYVNADTGEVALLQPFTHWDHHFPPEATKQPYDPTKADIWAFGSLIFAMLTQHHPYDTKSPHGAEMQWQVKLEKNLIKLSDEARTLFSRCLADGLDARPTIFEVMELDWFKSQ